MPETTPFLASPRLTLRPVSKTDVTALHQHWIIPDVRRYLWDDHLIERSQVAEIVAESERRFAEQGHGLWTIEQTGADALLGCGGYWVFHEPPRLELIISLSPGYWHQGFASEAAHLLINYAFTELGFEEVLASTDAPNAASLRMIDRLGFDFSHRAAMKGLDTLFYRLPARTC